MELTIRFLMCLFVSLATVAAIDGFWPGAAFSLLVAVWLACFTPRRSQDD